VQFAVSYCIMLLFMYSNGKFFFQLISQWVPRQRATY
jgi:hypothetical protein